LRISKKKRTKGRESTERQTNTLSLIKKSSESAKIPGNRPKGAD